MTPKMAFAAYQRIARRLPQPKSRPQPQKIQSILELIPSTDIFFFDAFGVLNVGKTPIPHVAERIRQLKKAGKHCFVISNGGGFERSVYQQKYRALGYDFSLEEIVSSRDALLLGLADYPAQYCWGIIGSAGEQRDITALGYRQINQDAPDFFARADGFLFLSSMRWNDEKQNTLIEALTDRPRPLLLANPDLIAPQSQQSSIEAGSYVLLLPNQLFNQVRVFGKPYPLIYEIARQRLRSQKIVFNPERCVMIGDTLHTDILGGNAFGIKTALVTDYGFLRAADYQTAIAESGIFPDYVLNSP